MAENTYLQVNVNKKERDKFSDFKIKVEGKSFSVHRWVLNTHSRFFRAMFENDMLESKQGLCEMNDVTEEGVKQCIDFMYGKELELNEVDVANVLQVSHMWQLNKATEECVNFLKSNLNVKSCIQVKQIANLYNFKELAEECVNFIANYLSAVTAHRDLADIGKNDVIQIIAQAYSRVSDLEVMWMFCSAWASTQDDQNSSDICPVFDSFPIVCLTTEQFQSFIWANEHVEACDVCKVNLSSKFLQQLQKNLCSPQKTPVSNTVGLSRNISNLFQNKSTTVTAKNNEKSPFEIGNCLFIKKMAKTYKFDVIEKQVDAFIVSNLKEIMKQKDFMGIPKDDFVTYVTGVDEYFKKYEFVSIVKWIQRYPDRHDVFPALFISSGSPSTVMKWNIILDQCFFVRSLALQFQCRDIEFAIDEFMVINFAQISTKKEFLHIREKDLKKYLSSEAIYRCDDETIWNAINKWINADYENRRNAFQDIFNSLRLDKLSNLFLRTTICTDKRTRESSLCTSKLMDYLLDKTEKHETEIKQLRLELDEINRRLKGTKYSPQTSSNPYTSRQYANY